MVFQFWWMVVKHIDMLPSRHPSTCQIVLDMYQEDSDGVSKQDAKLNTIAFRYKVIKNQ